MAAPALDEMAINALSARRQLHRPGPRLVFVPDSLADGGEPNPAEADHRWRLLFGFAPLGPTYLLARQVALGDLPLADAFVSEAAPAPVPRLAAAVVSQRVPHERWTHLSLQQRFAAAHIEAALEGLTSEPMAAQVRHGRHLMPLRRAGLVLGVQFGAKAPSPPLLATVGLAGERKRFRPIWQRGQGFRPAASMRLSGHARRWLGHGRRPHLDTRWQADMNLALVQQNGERLAELGGRATWRQVVGERGQVVQVGSFPIVGNDVPYVLYEPLVGFEDLARYTAHMFACEARAQLRLARWLAAGVFASANLVDRFSQEWRDSWLTAVGPCLQARLPWGGSRGLLVQVQSARRAGNEHDPWLHLVTLGA